MSAPEPLNSFDDVGARRPRDSAPVAPLHEAPINHDTNAVPAKITLTHDNAATSESSCDSCASEHRTTSNPFRCCQIIQVRGAETIGGVRSALISLTTDDPADIRLEQIQTVDEFHARSALWRALDRQVASPLAQFIWTRACLSAFVNDGSPRITTANRHDQFVAVAPMVKRRFRAVQRLFMAGVRQLHEPADFIWSDELALARVLESLASSGLPVLLERLPAESPSIDAISRAYRGRGVIIKRPQSASPYITLDESWLEPEQHLNSGRRSDLRRARRKAEKLGQVTTEIHTPDQKALPQLLDVALHVESKNWKGAARTALIHDAERAQFFRQYAEAACAEGILRICFLRIGENVAAMQLTVEQGGGFWLLKVGYDEEFAACSPGLLLMRDTIRYSAEAGLRTYEFLGMAESWTAVWTQTEHPTIALWIYPFGLRGLWALAVDSTAKFCSRWSQR